MIWLLINTCLSSVPAFDNVDLRFILEGPFGDFAERQIHSDLIAVSGTPLGVMDSARSVSKGSEVVSPDNLLSAQLVAL